MAGSLTLTHFRGVSYARLSLFLGGNGCECDVRGTLRVNGMVVKGTPCDSSVDCCQIWVSPNSSFFGLPKTSSLCTATGENAGVG